MDLRPPISFARPQAATLDAMRDGADVIFQATFFDGRWRGHADFLFKRPERPSPIWAGGATTSRTRSWLARVKAGAILQMCVYADLLERLQGTAPEWLYVITGDGVEHPHRPTTTRPTSDGSALGSMRASLAGLAGGPTGTYPDPVDHCRVCVWYPMCIDSPSRPTTTCRSSPGCAASTRSGSLAAGDHRPWPALPVLATDRADHGIARPS